MSISLLKTRLREVSDINAAGAVLYWDQSTYMPPEGAESRGRQTALLSRLAHEKATDAETGRLIDAAEKEAARLPDDHEDRALIRVARRDYDRARRLPDGPDFLGLETHAPIVARKAGSGKIRLGDAPGCAGTPPRPPSGLAGPSIGANP